MANSNRFSVSSVTSVDTDFKDLQHLAKELR